MSKTFIGMKIKPKGQTIEIKKIEKKEIKKKETKK